MSCQSKRNLPWRLGRVEYVPVGWSTLQEWEKQAYDSLDVIRPTLKNLAEDRPELLGPRRLDEFISIAEAILPEKVNGVVPYFMPTVTYTQDNKHRVNISVSIIKPESMSHTIHGRLYFFEGHPGFVEQCKKPYKTWYSTHAIERMRERLGIGASRDLWSNVLLQSAKRDRIIGKDLVGGAGVAGVEFLSRQIRYGPRKDDVLEIYFPLVRENNNVFCLTMLSPGMAPCPAHHAPMGDVLRQHGEWIKVEMQGMQAVLDAKEAAMADDGDGDDNIRKLLLDSRTTRPPPFAL